MPSGLNTATALIKVSSGSLTDVSDSNFRILGTPGSLSATAGPCAGSLNFSWPSVTNATHYALLKLDPATGLWDTLNANISGTTYAATGLPVNSSLWFTLVAKNNATKAISDRALAINRTTSGTGSTPLANISGPASVCGNQTTTYSVASMAGISTYTWSVPAGATILSGQGSTTISVNFTPSSTSGSVTVFGTASGCQTSTSSLTVTVGNNVAAPVSGGDQTSCTSTSSALTATATVPTGFTVVWYNAASGGTVISNPVLNAPGTVTYYAASRSSNGACESQARTPVTLTLNTTTPAMVTASGPVTFCAGGSVTLTANAGSAYLWTNGATTQSITVNASGSYYVTVTQPNGCSSTSSPMAVQVNPLPVASISASGATTICQGETITLTASTGDTYLWSTGATTQSITVTQGGSYSVTVNQATGCSNTSTPVVVQVEAIPLAEITANGATAFCEGGKVTLTASPGNTYRWSTGETSQAISVDRTGAYSVTVTSAAGCSKTSNPVSVNVSPIPTVALVAEQNTSLLPGERTTLKASANGTGTFTWLKNGTIVANATANTLPVSIDELGEYSVKFTSQESCSATSNKIAIQAAASNDLFLYPNPNKGQFQIRYYSEPGIVSSTAVLIYDSKGARVASANYTVKVAYDRLKVDMRNEGSGIYYVVLQQENGKKLASGRVVVL
ncbi:Ig-like domain-containing protein [Adhaeribacter soli]|uniref:Ig-like domain-containing protein n=1 Tax=Adhaeribacter soli TaxID=2607655 RepID=UPI0037432499